MKHSSHFISLLSITILLSGCCAGVDCAGYGGSITLRLLKDGQNVIGGQAAQVSIDDVIYYPVEAPFLSNPVYYGNDTLSVSMLLDADDLYILELGDLGNDTISVTAESIGNGTCGCFEYRLTGVTYNGELICAGECDEVIEVDI